MKAPKPISENFVDEVHRRMVVVGMLEQIGLGLFAGSLLAILLTAVAVWQSLPTLPILLTTGLLGLFGGIVLAIHRWPTRRRAAVEADRQLRLDDLLLTTISLSNSSDDFVSAIRAMADARCRLHSPSDVIFRRFGVNKWGTIALTMSVAVTLAVIPFNAVPSQAIVADRSVLSANEDDTPALNVRQVDRHSIASSNNPMSENTSTISSSTQQQVNPDLGEQSPVSPGKVRGSQALTAEARKTPPIWQNQKAIRFSMLMGAEFRPPMELPPQVETRQNPQKKGTKAQPEPSEPM